MAMQRAQDKIDEMQARAGAMDELLASGALTDLTSPNDDIQAQLDKASTTSTVGTWNWQPSKQRWYGAPAPAELGSADQKENAVVIVRILGEGQYSIADEGARHARSTGHRGCRSRRQRRRSGLWHLAGCADRRGPQAGASLWPTTPSLPPTWSSPSPMPPSRRPRGCWRSPPTASARATGVLRNGSMSRARNIAP